jgi:hypothetical protein
LKKEHRQVKEILLRNMTVAVSRRKVMRRLGKGLKSEMNAALVKIFEEEYSRALALARVDCVAARMNIVENDGGRICLSNETGDERGNVGIIIESVSVSDLLKGCGSAYLFCVTAGPALTNAATALVRDGETAHALVIDAVGSELVEEAADEVCRYIERTAAVSLTKRFSPGYGDWDLFGQHELDKALNISRIGVTLNEAFLMMPEKTITAVAGVIKNK